MQDLVRATGVASHQDELSYRQTGQRKKRLEEVGQQDLLANRTLILLGVRVRDQLLRGLINQLRDKDADLLLLILEPEFERLQAMTSLAELAGQIHERVGELLRTMDDEEEESTVERN